MSEEKILLKASALSARSLSFLSSLDSVFKNKTINKRSDTLVLSQEFCTYQNHIKWLIERSSLDKKGMRGQCIESPAIKSNWPHIRKFLLYPNGRRLHCAVAINISFKDLPKNMYIHCEVAVLGKAEDILTSKIYSGDTSDLKEINFDDFFHKKFLHAYLVDNKLSIMCLIKCISKVHKCVSDKNKHQAQEIFESNNFRRSLVKGQYSDVTLKLDSKIINLHKFILASESPALAILLRSSNQSILDLREHKTAVIEDLLSFIYTQNIEVLKFNHVCELYITADKFGVMNLRDICSVYLSNCLTRRNVPYILNLSTHFKDQYLMDMCLKYVKQNDIQKDTFLNF